MESKLKYRLVGAGVIVAIMAFFLPLILDSKKYRTEIVSQIPPMPKQDVGQMSRFEAEQLELENKVKAAKQRNGGSSEGQLFIDLDADPDKAVTKIEPQKKPVTNSVAEQKGVIAKKEESKAKPETTKKILDEKKQTQDKVAATNTPKPQKITTKKSNIEQKAQKVANKVKPKVVKKSKDVKQDPKKQVKKDAKKVAKTVKKPVKKAVSQPSSVKKEPVPKPTLKENYYLVQIGTFSNKANASKLVTNLREKEYRAYERVSEKFSRVFVGPYPDKKSAEKRAKKLSEVVGSKVKIVVFDPVVH